MIMVWCWFFDEGLSPVPPPNESGADAGSNQYQPAGSGDNEARRWIRVAISDPIA